MTSIFSVFNLVSKRPNRTTDQYPTPCSRQQSWFYPSRNKDIHLRQSPICSCLLLVKPSPYTNSYFSPFGRPILAAWCLCICPFHWILPPSFLTISLIPRSLRPCTVRIHWGSRWRTASFAAWQHLSGLDPPSVCLYFPPLSPLHRRRTLHFRQQRHLSHIARTLLFLPTL
jgi:hypothetical protein